MDVYKNPTHVTVQKQGDNVARVHTAAHRVVILDETRTHFLSRALVALEALASLYYESGSAENPAADAIHFAHHNRAKLLFFLDDLAVEP